MRFSSSIPGAARALAAAVLIGATAGLAAGTALAAPAPGVEDAPAPGQQKQAAVDPQKLQTFGIGPANARGLDRRPAFVYAGRPGTVIKDRVALLNFTFRPLKVKVYASDAFTSRTGAFDVLPAAQKPKELGAWTSLKPRQVTIPARSKAANAPPTQVVIPFQIKVPKGTGVGDHAAGIVASTSTAAIKGKGTTTGVVVDRRVGTRIYLRVPGALEPELTIKNLKVAYLGTLNPVQPGKARVDYVVKNTGNVALSAVQRVRIDGLIGTSASSAPLGDLVQILPGDSVVVSTVVDGVWPTLRVKAVVALDPYAGTVDAKEQFPTVSASATTWAIPWALLALIIAIAMAVYFVERRRRRPSPELDPASDQREEVLVP